MLRPDLSSEEVLELVGPRSKRELRGRFAEALKVRGGVVHFGSEDANHFWRIYDIRLQHLRDRGIELEGLADAVDHLRRLPGDARVGALGVKHEGFHYTAFV